MNKGQFLVQYAQSNPKLKTEAQFSFFCGCDKEGETPEINENCSVG
jgi:hypothetical protein